MTNKAWPNPDEMSEMVRDLQEMANKVAITQDEAVVCLTTMALYLDKTPGCGEPDCEACNEILSCFWNISNALPIPRRVSYQRALRLIGVPLPDAPWERVGV